VSAPRIRVLHAIDSLRIGGAQLLLAGLLEGLGQQRDEFESHVVVTAASGASSDLVERVRERCASLTLIESRRLADPVLIRSVGGLVRRLRPDVIHSQLIDANVTTRLAACASGVPHVTTVQIPPFPLADSSRARTLADGATTRLSSRLVAVSDDTADGYARAFRIDRTRIEVIPNTTLPRPPADGFDRPAKRAELGALNGAPLIACVARLEPHKGIADLIEATAMWRRRVPGARVVVAGSGSAEGELRVRAAEAGLNGSFRLLGARDDVGEVLAAADAFCLPSHHEGLPVAVIEAMQAGLPCVVTSASGMAEMVGGGEAGIVVRPGAPAEIAAALERATGPEAARLAAGAGRIAAERYSPAAVAGRYGRIYRELAAA
jgi:glycosyltransferase involved in cell wall biosynthesis